MSTWPGVNACAVYWYRASANRAGTRNVTSMSTGSAQLTTA